jgi:hypothetical protein
MCPHESKRPCEVAQLAGSGRGSGGGGSIEEEAGKSANANDCAW